jgi:gamma-glutamylcyclotransferase (GGCT)/AIG2-like uncharacterized protein YtfP
MEDTPIFVYGTLKQGEKLFYHISHTVRDAIPACIKGKLYDTPFGYPLLVCSDDDTALPISGMLLTARDGQYGEMMRIIDVIEGEAGFSKELREVTLENGSAVQAVVHCYHEVPPYAQPYAGTSWP